MRLTLHLMNVSIGADIAASIAEQFTESQGSRFGLLCMVCDRQEMLLAPTAAGGEDAASTAGQEASVTNRNKHIS